MVSAREWKAVESFEDELRSLAGKPGGNWEVRARYLREVRRLRLRRSELVASHGLALLGDDVARHNLGDEVHDVREQVALAAMDCGRLTQAKACIGALMITFPGSARVGRLEGQWLEASGLWEQADKVYAQLLERDPQDQVVLKRQVAMLKSRGNAVGAVAALKKYLETFMADFEAWRELGDLYISLAMFKQAAFCYEELLLSGPANPLYHVTYAELLYSMGSPDNLRSALSHFAAAIEYSGGANVRALYGTCMASAALQASTKSSRSGSGDGSSADTDALAAAAKEALQQEYRVKCPSLLKSVVEPSLVKLAES